MTPPDPSPAFPAWLRRMDPVLAAEDTNPLFIAFRRHRRLHGSWRTKLLGDRSLFTAKPEADTAAEYTRVVLTFLGLSVVTFGAFYFVGLLPFVFASSRRRLNCPHLPKRALMVFAIRGVVNPAALDTAMTGCTGRDVLEAIYLETRELQRSVIVAVQLVALALLWVLFVRFGDWASFLGAAFLLTGTAAIASLFPLLWVSNIDQQAAMLRLRAQFWRGPTVMAAFWRCVKASMIELLRVLLKIAIMMVIVILAVAAIRYTLNEPVAAFFQWLHTMTGGRVPVLLSCGLFGLVTFAAVQTVRRSADNFTARLREVLAAHDDDFRAFVDSVVFR